MLQFVNNIDRPTLEALGWDDQRIREELDKKIDYAELIVQFEVSFNRNFPESYPFPFYLGINTEGQYEAQTRLADERRVEFCQSSFVTNMSREFGINIELIEVRTA